MTIRIILNKYCSITVYVTFSWFLGLLKNFHMVIEIWKLSFVKYLLKSLVQISTVLSFLLSINIFHIEKSQHIYSLMQGTCPLLYIASINIISSPTICLALTLLKLCFKKQISEFIIIQFSHYFSIVGCAFCILFKKFLPPLR